MTYKSLEPVKQSDGWHLWIYFSVDDNIYTRCQRFLQKEKPTQEQIDAAIVTQRGFVEIEGANLIQREYQDNLQSIYSNELSGTPLVIAYNRGNRPDFIIYLRQTYMVLTQDWCAIVGHWLQTNVTDVEAKSIFNISDIQLAALKTKFTNNWNAWLALKAVKGQ